MIAGLRFSLTLTCAALAIGVLLPAAAHASAPVSSFATTPASTQAGGHADLMVRFDFDSENRPRTDCECNLPKDITVNTPPGFLGFPTNIPRCTLAQLTLLACPADSQVGVAYIEVGRNAFLSGVTLAVFNMVPNPDQAALLAFEFPAVGISPVFTSFTVRTESDFGLEAKTFGIIKIGDELQLSRVGLIFWGVPGDPAHESLRFPFGGISSAFGSRLWYQFACRGADPTEELFEGINPLWGPDGNCVNDASSSPEFSAPTPYNSSVEPFTTNPTNCSGPLTSSIEVLAYDQETAQRTAPYPAITGCELLTFNPSLAAKPTTTGADSPSGLDVELKVPVPSAPEAPSPSQIRGTEMVLPEGFSVNSNSADGKVACTDQQAHFGTRLRAQCPESSKIGTLAIETSALPGVISGALYLGEPLPGNRYRVFLTADGFSLHIKLEGRAEADPVTGRLSVIFENLPQAPFQRFTLHVFGGERGLLATPEQCGTYPVETHFTPWDDALPEQSSTQFFTIDSGPDGSPCPSQTRSFFPSFTAGVVDSTAAAFTPFAVQLSRPDGDQYISGLTVKTPPGFSAIIAGVPYCPEPAIQQLARPIYSGLVEQSSSVCPVASRIGTAIAAAGAGSKPFNAPGSVYLAGPYRGSPLSLVVVIPAVSGPYDLGNVAVRVAVEVDPVTAQVTAVSDPLPRIIEGIPLRTRSIDVRLDRPDFVINPTSCDPFAVEALATGDQGATAVLSSHFQASNCADLPYRPKLSLHLTGGLRRRGHPAIHAVITAARGEANSRRVSVTLPKGELLDNSHIGAVCTRVQFAKDACPTSSLIGTAQVSSPILERPLSGNVYLRSSSHDLPDIALDLSGQFDIEAVGRVDSVKARFRTIFDAIPDVPVSRIRLDLLGGAKGLLQNTETLCGANKRASFRMTGQNGKRLVGSTELRTECGKAGRLR